MRSLLAHADLVTPNLPELAVLLDEPVAATWAGALDQGARLAARTASRCWSRAATSRANRAGARTPS